MIVDFVLEQYRNLNMPYWFGNKLHWNVLNSCKKTVYMRVGFDEHCDHDIFFFSCVQFNWWHVRWKLKHSSIEFELKKK